MHAQSQLTRAADHAWPHSNLDAGAIGLAAQSHKFQGLIGLVIRL